LGIFSFGKVLETSLKRSIFFLIGVLSKALFNADIIDKRGLEDNGPESKV
jgi:hypothetical protein